MDTISLRNIVAGVVTLAPISFAFILPAMSLLTHLR